MAANSMGRRLLKRLLYPVLNEKGYQLCQALAAAWDIRKGNWSEPELDLIPFAVREGEVALDIGANYGLYAFHLSRALGPLGRIYAFEPVPFTYSTLGLVARLLQLRNVELVPKGCSERTGRAAFAVPVQCSGPISAGQAHFGQRNDEREGREKHAACAKTREVWCDVVALDDFLPNPSLVSFIKCDIEGAELLALRGAEAMIERLCPTVLCEVNPWFLEGFSIRLEDLLGFFARKGYSLYRYEVTESRGRLLKTVAEQIVEDNYLFVHPRRQDRFASLLEPLGSPDPWEPPLIPAPVVSECGE